MYACCQLTRTIHQLVVESDEAGDDLTLAVPTFNMHSYKPEEMPMFEKALAAERGYNAKVFGPLTTEAIVRVIEWLNSHEILRSLLRSAAFERNTFVINQACDRMKRLFCDSEDVVACVEGDEARARVRSAQNSLRAFLSKCETVSVDGPLAWYAFVNEQLGTADWKQEHQMHVQSVLMLFGLQAEEAKACAGPRHKLDPETGQPDQTKRGDMWRALEWLTKMLSAGFGPAGATSDLVNLIYALERKDVDEPVAQVLDAFRERRLIGGDLDGLRPLPKHMLIDGELDDTLAWKLLAHLHEQQGSLSTFKVTVQLPDLEAPEPTPRRNSVGSLKKEISEERKQKLISFMKVLRTKLSAEGVDVVLDDLSWNGEKVMDNGMWNLPELDDAAIALSDVDVGATVQKRPQCCAIC